MMKKILNAVFSKKFKSLSVVVAVIIVFVTTYALILPAITMETDAAKEDPGISLQEEADDHGEAALVTQTDPVTETDSETEDHTSQEASGEDALEAGYDVQNYDNSENGVIGGADTADQLYAAYQETAYDVLYPAMTFETEIMISGEISSVPGLTEEELLEKELLEKETADASDPDEEAKEKKEIILKVKAEAGEGMLPEGTIMKVEEVASDRFVSETVKDAAENATGGKMRVFQAVDIKFLDPYGEEIHPDGQIRITITSDTIKEEQNADGQEQTLIHIKDDGTSEVIDEIEAWKLETPLAEDEVIFEADTFSVYALVYTVDFSYNADDLEYSFSFPGGSGVSIRDLISVLGIVSDDPETGEDEVQEFVDHIADVTFTDPGLVWLGTVTYDNTIADIKEFYGLECEYSAGLTQEDIDEINAREVHAGEWALISLRPFTTEETLTITMKNGEQIVVNVTDHQIFTNVLTSDGKTYNITLTFDDDAEIPAGTKLVVKEIRQDSEEYIQLVGRTWMEVNKEYFEQEELKNKDEDFVPEDIPLINIDQARFFDISLVYGKDVIEPKAPVQVNIRYVNGMGIDQVETSLAGISHFVEGSIELIDEVETSNNKDGKIIEFSYEQDSFSDIGTYIGHETRDGEAGYDIPDIDLAGMAAKRSVRSDGGIGEPEAHKYLDDNEDGTYTLSLNVKANRDEYTVVNTKKSNVLFIMDRSSSMIREVGESYIPYDSTEAAVSALNNGSTVYGDVNGNHPSLNYVEGSWYYSRMGIAYQYDPANGLYYRLSGNRLPQEQAALKGVVASLMGKNDPSGDNSDLVEVSIISFATFKGKDQTRTYDGRSWSGTEVGWRGGNDTSALVSGIDDTDLARGTNWEEALKYAKEVMDAKKQEDGTDEDYYIVFLTDGAPTATTWSITTVEGSGDYGAYYGTEGHNASQLDGQNRPRNSCEPAYEDAKDDALALVNAGYKLYNIFTYGNNDDYNYMIRLTNYAYSNGADDTNTETQYVRNYFTNATNTGILVDAFNNIFSEITGTIGHAQVKITDGLTAGAMTSTFINGKPSGVRYIVTPEGSETPLYTVTATIPEGGTEPVVTFVINGTSYTTTNGQVTKKNNPEDAYDKGEYYSVTVDGKEYKMALASVASGGELTWDLTPVGTLMDATYTAEFIVWPNQEAYNYVAGLNNGLSDFTWTLSDDDTEHLYTDSNGYRYLEGGAPGIASIVKYLDGPNAGTYAVLTNTHQELRYSVATTEGDEVTVSDPIGPVELETPDPMPLNASESSVEKVWNVDRNPGILAQLLYDLEGNPTKFSIDYAIYRDGIEDPYLMMTLGWDEKLNKYIWDEASVRQVRYNGNRVLVGMRWSEDFAIATGLMLSEDRMDELKMDKTAYPHYSYGSTNYYILETGYDYTIKEIVPDEEDTWLTYEFDFVSPVYHPMLVDGKLKSVSFGKDNGEITGIDEISKDDWLVSLKIENTLRGYINLEKVVVDKDGVTPLEDDDTKFTYTVDLTNSTDPGPFTEEGNNIPWYGINGLFYHDANWNYYQAETNTEDNKAHQFMLTTESGSEFTAWVSDENGGDLPDELFDEDAPGPTWITYNDGSQNITIQLYGNEMTRENDNHVYATMKINQDEILNIANVPVGTEYTVTETAETGYDLISIVREIRNGSTVESSAASSDISGGTITGTVVADRDNHIIFTNKIYSADITVKKVDENNKPLTGASFTLTKSRSGEETEDTVIIKPAGGETDTGIYKFADLADGSYTLHETAPSGYTAVSDITFTVEGGVIKNVVKPEGVSWNGDTMTFTVTNNPVENEGQITVRKQWLDYNGNADEPGETSIDLTLKRTVDVPQTKKLKIVVAAGNTRREREITIDSSSYRVSWYDNGQFQWNGGRISYTCSDSEILVSDGISSHGDPSTHDGNNNAIWNISNLQNASQDPVTVTFTYQNGYNGDNFMSWFAGSFASYVPNGNSITITGTGNAVQAGSGDPVEDDWSEVITLNDANGWRVTRTDLPADDGNGNTYHYYIEEADLDGYEVTYSANNGDGIQSGVLTAYNQKTTQEGMLQINKKVQENGSLNKTANGTFYYAVYSEPYNVTVPPTPVASGSITVMNGIGSATVRNLDPGTYYVYELTGEGGSPVTGGVGSINGTVYAVTGSGASTPVGETAGIVSLTNNHETTQLTVTKAWNDSPEVAHDNDTITFMLYQTALNANEEHIAEIPYAGDYTNSITGSGTVTISDLPKNGLYGNDNIPVTYSYYVVEEHGKEGYIQEITQDESAGAWTITNIAPSDEDIPTDITFTKTWQDKDGNDVTASGHNDDTIQVKLIQKAVDSGYVPVTVQLHGVTGTIIRSEKFYVKKGEDISLTVRYGGSILGGFLPVPHSAALSTSRSNADRQNWSTTVAGNHTFSVTGINEGITVALRLSTFTDSWAAANASPGTYEWSNSVSGTDLKDSAEAVAEEAKDNPAVGEEHEYLYELGKNTITDGPFEESAEDWIGTVEGLPLYWKIDDGTYYTYYYTIDEVSINGEAVSGKVTSGSTTTGYNDDYTVVIDEDTLTITNKEREKVDADASKVWSNADNTSTPPSGGSVTFELYADGAAAGKPVVLDGTADPDTGDHGEFTAWKAEWKDLPKYRPDGTTPIEYIVKEAAVYPGYTNQNPDGVNALAEAAADRVITNKEEVLNFDILKVDGQTEEPLPDAAFTIRQIKESSSTTQPEYEPGSSESAPAITKGDGKTSFTNVKPGYYEVKEKATPEGYVITGDDAFYIRADSTGVKLLKKVVGEHSLSFIEAAPGEKVGNVTADTSGTTVTFEVENTPGAELPVTGGPGTRLLAALGITFIAAAGGWMLMKRRRKEAA